MLQSLYFSNWHSLRTARRPRPTARRPPSLDFHFEIYHTMRMDSMASSPFPSRCFVSTDRYVTYFDLSLVVVVFGGAVIPMIEVRTGGGALGTSRTRRRARRGGGEGKAVSSRPSKRREARSRTISAILYIFRFDSQNSRRAECRRQKTAQVAHKNIFTIHECIFE